MEDYLRVPPPTTDALQDEGAAARQLRFWLQTFAGNWSSDNPPALVSKRQYALSAVLAVLLNNGLYFAIILLIWRVIAERRRVMKLATIFALKDLAIRDSVLTRVLSVIPEDQKDKVTAKIDEGLTAANQRWFHRHIDAVFGKKQGDQVRKILVEENLEPK